MTSSYLYAYYHKYSLMYFCYYAMHHRTKNQNLSNLQQGRRIQKKTDRVPNPKIAIYVIYIAVFAKFL